MSTALQLAAEHIDAIPEFKPRAQYTAWVEAPIHACNASVLPPRNLARTAIKRPSTPVPVPVPVPAQPQPDIIEKPPESEEPVPCVPEADDSENRKGHESDKASSICSSSRLGSSSSSGLDQELIQRYWAYLFENLERSISEIYDTCEKQDNILQCREVLLLLGNYSRDFENLIEWIHLKSNYEQMPENMRPLAWEIRKPSFTALPHTRAYEQLLGLHSSSKSKSKPPKLPDPPPREDPELVSEKESSGTSSATEIPTSPVSEPRDESETQSEEDAPEVLPITAEIGLQTDLEEDPDVYYFAGGRHVGCQPDYDTEYGPLEPFQPGSSPIVVLMMTSDIDIPGESPTDIACETLEVIARPMTPSPNTPIEMIETKSSATQLSFGGLTESTDEITPIEELKPAEDLKPVEVKPAEEVKPKVVQKTKTFGKPKPLEKPKLVEKAKPSEKIKPADRAKDDAKVKLSEEIPVTSKSKDTSTTDLTAMSTVTAPKPGVTSSPSTYSEKVRCTARTNQGSSAPVPLQQKSFLVGVPRPRPTTLFVSPIEPPVTSAPSSARGTKMSINVNYRSNIASRCRTAVNKGAPIPITSSQPSTAQVPASPTGTHKVFSLSTSSAAAAATTHVKALSSATLASNNSPAPLWSPRPKLKAPIPHFNFNVSKSLSNSRSNLANPEPPVTAAAPTKTTAPPSVPAPQQTSVIPPSPRSAKKSTPPESKWTHQQAKPALAMTHAQRGGVFRSKSMINASAASNSLARAKEAGKVGASRKAGDLSGVSSAVTHGDFMKRRTMSNVGEDGWETVRARSNRSKWSLSSCSSSTNDLVTAPAPAEPAVPEKEIKQQETAKSLTTSWKDDETTSSVDEEIKQKDADLDCAIREEELLEEELLQVEKDFEAIELSRGPATDVSSEGRPPSESTTSPDPDTLSLSEDLENSPLIITPPVLSPSPAVVDPPPAKKEKVEKKKSVKKCHYLGVEESKQPKAEEFPPREPGRIVTLREKLMLPAKRCDGAETLKRHQDKLAKAERNRERLLQAKYNRYVELSDRFKALNETTKRLVEERAKLVARAEERRRRAVQKREENLRNIRMKAHDEDSKTKEIAFINSMDAQIKRHDYLASVQEVDQRLLSRDEERKAKLEERGAKAAGVLERQFRIRNNWQAKLDKLEERRRKTQERIMRERQERAKERSELAQEKQRDRDDRVSALNAAKQARKEELKKVIQQKQQDTARRHEENMEHIRQRAFELTIPRTSEDSAVRMCTLCKVVIQSEVQELIHLRGRAHLDAVKKMEKTTGSPNTSPTVHVAENFGLKFIADVHLDKVEPGLQTDKNRHKTMKKHCKKILQKLESIGKEFEAASTPSENNEKHYGEQKKLLHKMQRNIREIDRLVKLFTSEKGSVHLATSLDRLLTETRKLAVRNKFIQESLLELGLFPVVQSLFDCKSPDLPGRVYIGACNLIIGSAFQNLANTLYIIRSSCICNILQFTAARWDALVPDDNRWLCGSPVGANEPLPVDSVVESAMELLFNILNVIPDPYSGINSKQQTVVNAEEIKQIQARVLDIIGYIVCSGIVDRLSVYCAGVRGPLESQPLVANLLGTSIDLITTLIYTLQQCWDQKKPDSTQLIAALESSEILGTISMSYSLVIYQGAPTRPRALPCSPEDMLNGNQVIPPPPGTQSASVVKSTLGLVNAFAALDINVFQDVLGSEALSLQFRHITSQLLWQIVPYFQKTPLWTSLIHQLVIAVGNFTVQNKHNQTTIQSGQTPTVLQQICSLPRPYFDEPKFSKSLFPTLIAATYGCPENQDILTQQNISLELLDGFMKSEYAKVNTITKRLLPADNKPDIVTSSVPASANNTRISSVSSSPSKKSKAKKSHSKKTTNTTGTTA